MTSDRTCPASSASGADIAGRLKVARPVADVEEIASAAAGSIDAIERRTKECEALAHVMAARESPGAPGLGADEPHGVWGGTMPGERSVRRPAP
ncbi:MAG: hypothetical protein M0Z46_06400 [Actinomycetota bacterium]|nr:hypothetical protein [Actinomycetota bacterium]